MSDESTASPVAPDLFDAPAPIPAPAPAAEAPDDDPEKTRLHGLLDKHIPADGWVNHQPIREFLKELINSL